MKCFSTLEERFRVSGPCPREELSTYRSTRWRAIFLRLLPRGVARTFSNTVNLWLCLQSCKRKLNKNKNKKSVRIQERVSDLVQALTQAPLSYHDDQHYEILNHSHL